MRPHPDTDQLALLALGEAVLAADELAHVTACGRCSRTVDELSDTVRVVRGPAADDVAAVPVPAHVWQGIAEELGLDAGVRPTSVGPSAVVQARLLGTGVTRVPAAPASPAGPVASEPSAAGSPVDEVQARRARRGNPLRFLAVAAAGLVVGAAGATAVLQWAGDASAPTVAAPTVGSAEVASAELLEFGAGEGTGVSGAARLAVLGNPTDSQPEDRVLRVRLEALPDTGDDFLEAWLIDADTGAMVSLGTVPVAASGAATAELAVPRGLDVTTYDLVDVSAEPLDGDPTHSGVSLVRGTLGT